MTRASAFPSIFNDVIGPVMRGPSSSHSAAALRIGRIAGSIARGVRPEAGEADSARTPGPLAPGRSGAVLTCAQMLAYDAGRELALWELALHYESVRAQIPRAEIVDKMCALIRIMRSGIVQGIEGTQFDEGVVRMACECVSRVNAGPDGVLQLEGEPLTSTRLRTMVGMWLIKRGYSDPGAIIAGDLEGSDCHNLGSGPLRTGVPVIVDIFPRNNATKYCGDCTRTVVHGEVSDEIHRMLDAVKEAKAAGITAIRPGVTGGTVHRIVAQVMEKNGYATGLPKDDAPAAYCAMTHGTGHGVGLDVHEPPLLDMNGPELLVGDVVTVEPGLYSQAIGGVRLEDMVVVTPAGCEILNRLPEVLSW